MSISETLRQHIEACGESRYEIARGSGIAQSALARFISGERTMTLASADKLADYFGMELLPKRKGGRRSGKTV